MRHILQSQPVSLWVFRNVFIPLLLVGALAHSPASVGADPVTDLDNVLLADKKELKNPSEAVVNFREVNLRQKVDQLKTIGQLWRALSLKEWRDQDRPTNMSIRVIDLEMRNLVGNRLSKALEERAKSGDANTRLAVANSIAERGPTIRALGIGSKAEVTGSGDRAGYLRTLTPLVIELTEDRDLGVRQEALRALSNIFAKPDEAAAVFKKALDKDDARNIKLIAAEGLGQLIRVVNHLRPEKRGLSETTGVFSKSDDVLETVTSVLDSNSSGLRDADPQVRTRCLENVQLAAETLADLTRGPQKDLDSERDFPPEGRKLTDLEKKLIQGLQLEIGGELSEFVPVLTRLRAQDAALAADLQDADNRVRQAAVSALETIGNAWTRLRIRVLSVPPVDGDDGGNRALLAKNDPLAGFVRNNLPAIANLLGDPNAKLRLGIVNFLDSIEEAAAPALPWLTKTCAHDPNRYVRWAAARAIGKINNAAAAVPALAKLLSDPDLQVRLQATSTLKDLAPVAQAAVPALAAAITVGDVEGRLAAMDVLQAIGPEAGKAAVPRLIECLKSPEARVRRLAAKTLGGFGQDALAAIPALRERLGDDDQEVRIHASDAILELLPH